MIESSTANTSSIDKAIFHATIQLSVPTVSATSSVLQKSYSSTSINDCSTTSNLKYKLSALAISLSKHFNLNKRKIVRDTNNNTSLKEPFITDDVEHHSNHIDNNETTMATTVTSASQEYLSIGPYYESSTTRSSSFSSQKSNKSIKDSIVSIWQGLNKDNTQITATTNLDERPKKTAPKWKAFSKVVTTLLTFTRTKKERYEWLQLVGHRETFKEGVHDGFILKKLNENERYCFEALQNDALKDFVPKYNGTIKDDDQNNYIEIEDLLRSFHEPCIMDCKIGVRTYLEEELDKSERDPEPRADLYNKMITIDPLAPTEKEREEKKITKSRYMTWRESLCSTEDSGFRIEAIKKSRGLMSKDFHRIKERTDVKKNFCDFIASSLPTAIQYLRRLLDLRSTCMESNFFQNHEVIGSSLLFVHDETNASLWMIDFGKTRLLPNGINITHLKPWIRYSHEDGYLFGINNLISIFEEIVYELTQTIDFNLSEA